MSPFSHISGNLHPSSNAPGRTQEQHIPHPCGHSRAVLIPGFPAASPTWSSAVSWVLPTFPISAPREGTRAITMLGFGAPCAQGACAETKLLFQNPDAVCQHSKEPKVLHRSWLG